MGRSPIRGRGDREAAALTRRLLGARVTAACGVALALLGAGSVAAQVATGASARIDTEPAWFGDTIAFSSNRSASFDIYTVPAAGGDATQLTTHARHDVTPSWIGDGSMLVFASNEPGKLNFDLFAVKADGTDRTALVTHPAIDAFPEW